MKTKDTFAKFWLVGAISIFGVIPFVAPAATAVAQEAVATISIVVKDGTGAAMPSARITVSNTDRNQNWKGVSDDQGEYRFPYLPLGSYEVTVEQPGFGKYSRKLTLSVGQALEVPVTLAVASVNSSVQVTEEAPLIESARTQVASTISPSEIDKLPMNGRNYSDLALLVPGVSKTNTGSPQRFAETSAVPGTGISVAGQRNLGNGFIVDGLSANDDAADLAGTFFSPEVIREFQVITSGGIAEYGRAYGGIVNIATQSGTNQIHGKLYGFFRNDRMDGTNIFAPVDAATGLRLKPSLTQGQYGVSFGGPIQKDRAFFFANYEREDLHNSGFITISPANVTAINTVLDQFGYPAPRVATGAYPTGDARTSFFGKADFTQSPSNRLATRYSLYKIFSPNARGVGALNAVSRGTRVATTDNTFAMNDIYTISPSMVNEMRFQYARSRLNAIGNDIIGPAITINGVASFGASTGSPTGRNIDMFEFTNNISKQFSRHFLKAGVDVLYNRLAIEFPASFYGAYTFTSLANFQTGAYSTYGQAFGEINFSQTNPNVGWFVQDEWHARRNLTINLGFRHDVSRVDSGVQTAKTNFSPRIGLAYSPGDRKTVVRSGFGLYYDRIPLRAVSNSLQRDGTVYKAFTLQRTQVGAPVFPNKLTALPAGVLVNTSPVDPNIKTPYSIQANLQIDREVTRRISASAGYIFTRGIHLMISRNLNVPTLTAAQDPVNLGRPNPNYGNIAQYSSQGDSYYHGMTLAVQFRGSQWASLRGSYAFSKAIDTTGNNFFSAPQDNFNLRAERGLSDNDQRHRFTVSGQISAPRRMSSGTMYKVLEGFQLSPLFTYASPYPFNILTGAQTIQTTPARVGGRNTGVGFSYTTLDLRLSRKFQATERLGMELLVEGFNVLNHTNLLLPNATYGTGTTPNATFGKATAASDPRQVQLGLKLSF